MGYLILFVIATIFLRLLLQVLEDAIAPLRRHPHKFVHPLASPPEVKTRKQSNQSAQLARIPQSGSNAKGTRHGAKEVIMWSGYMVFGV
jgi:hypothetical protein